MDWDKPVKEVPPSSPPLSSVNGSGPQSELPQAGKPAWSEDIRAYYHAAAEPVPPDFMDLMAQIAKQIKK
jgi:hypothetical protein